MAASSHALLEENQQLRSQLELQPAKLYVLKHIWKKYACQSCEGHLVKAAKPPSMIKKIVATPALLAWVAR